MRYRGSTALVTGASSGIGEQFARALAARGTDLVLVARRGDRLESLAAELRQAHGVTVTPIVLDLTRPGQGATLHARLRDTRITVSLLVNNAGSGATGPFVDSDPATLHRLMTVNMLAVTDLTRALLPDLIASGAGALINIGSFTGFQPGPGMAVYAASKAYVLSFTEALAHELADAPIRVIALSPGSTRSEFYSTSGTSEQGVRFQTPAEVVATGLRALDARRTRTSVVSGRMNRVALHTLRWLPRRTAMALIAASSKPTPTPS